MTTTEGQGSMDMWLPFDRMSPDLLKRKRQPIPVGGGMQVTIQLQDGENGPPVGEPFAFLDGKIGVQYVSEFWTDIMEPLAAFRPDWVRSVTTGGTQLEGALGEAQAQLIRSDAADKALMADLDRFHREFVLKAFNWDALVAANLGAAFNVTRTFLPMVERRQAARDDSGSFKTNSRRRSFHSFPSSARSWRRESRSPTCWSRTTSIGEAGSPPCGSCARRYDGVGRLVPRM